MVKMAVDIVCFREKFKAFFAVFRRFQVSRRRRVKVRKTGVRPAARAFSS
jgi:hypothetical protein